MGPHDDALTLELLDWPLLLIRPGSSKAPVDKGWPTVTLTDSDLDTAFGKNHLQAIGVKLGGESAFVDIEGDGEQAQMDWEILTDGISIPETCQWTSARGRHRLFKLPAELRSKTGDGVIKVNDLEIRLGAADKYSHYSILPPFGQRSWDTDFQVADLPPELAARISQLAQTDLSPYNSDYVNPKPDAPGSVFNELETWDDVLLADGWKKVGSRQNGVSDWCRPGKPDGLSATTGFCGDRLYVFTTEAAGLESGVSYDKFQYITFTKYNGDFKEAAGDLARNGYIRESVLPFDVIDTGEEDELVAEVEGVSSELFAFPGFVEDFADYYVSTAGRGNKLLGVIGGMLLQSWLMGRRVQLNDGTRPNLYIMLLGKSGVGKTSLVRAVDNVLDALGCEGSLLTSVKGWQGLEDTLSEKPSLMYVQEEMQYLLRAMASPNAASHTAMMGSALNSIYTASRSFYRTRVGAKSGEPTLPPIDQPSLSALFTGIPSEVRNAMSHSMLCDGFLGRMLHFEIESLGERNFDLQTSTEVPQSILDHCRGWLRVTPDSTEPIEQDGVITLGKITPKVIPRTAGSKKLMMEHTIRWDAIAEGCRDEAESSMWNRANEMLCKLELNIAGSRSCADCLVDESVTNRAVQLVDQYLTRFFQDTTSKSMTDFDRLGSRMTALLQRKDMEGKDSVTWRDAHRYANISPVRMFNEVVLNLLSRGEIASDGTISPNGERFITRPTFFCLPKYAKKLLDGKTA